MAPLATPQHMQTAAPRSPSTVCAVLPNELEQLEPAVTAQSRAPEQVLRVADLMAGVTAALAESCEWLWLLDGQALPRRDALASLLEALQLAPALPAPVLLVGKAVTSDGALALGLAPWFRRGQTPVTMLAVSRRVLPVRAAGTASLLVRRSAALASAPPRLDLPPSAAALEWTARLLRHATGYLVPTSVADTAAADDGSSASLDARLRYSLRIGAAMLTSGGWHPKEKLWVVPEVVGSTLRRAPQPVRVRAGEAWRQTG